MSTIAIISEYNPFHLGHKYLIDKAKEITGATNVIAVMSGNYVQRGEPAILDKYTRAEISMKNGVDIVLELPVVYSTASAEFFAESAVTLINKLGVVDYLAFGCENDDIELLNKIAKYSYENSKTLSSSIKSLMKEGKTYAIALSTAIASGLTDCDENKINTALSTPNNILAIEYMKALLMLNSDIKPIPIKRINNNYHDDNIEAINYSATALRKALNSTISNEKKIPNDALLSLYSEYPFRVCANDYSLILGDKLISTDSYEDIFDISSDLSNRISSNLNNYINYDDFAMLLKSKNTTLSSIKRALIHILLNIKKDDIIKYRNNGYVDYVRIIGFKAAATPIIKEIAKSICTIINYAKDTKDLSAFSEEIIKKSLYADSLYRLILMNKYQITIPNEFNRKVLRLDD